MTDGFHYLGPAFSQSVEVSIEAGVVLMYYILPSFSSSLATLLTPSKRQGNIHSTQPAV